MTTPPLRRLPAILCCALVVASCRSSDAPAAPQDDADAAGLRTYADFPIGGAIAIADVERDERLREIIAADFNSVTSTNDFKAYTIAAEPGALDFSRADATARFAEANDLRLFGHALVWHAFSPEWIDALPPAETRDFLEAYIDTVVRRYRGRIDGWDVVNEAINTAGGGLRATNWRAKLGEDYMAEAFRLAHAADPDAKLFINDFNTERDTAKLSTLLETVAGLRQNGIPIHGIGFQMHIRVDTDTALVERSLRRAAATGLLIHVSELDISFNPHDDTRGGGVQAVAAMTPELLERQADQYEAVARIYRRAVPAAQRYGITFWDFTDRDSWIDGFFGVEDWPTVYDDDLERKPAWAGFRRGLESSRTSLPGAPDAPVSF